MKQLERDTSPRLRTRITVRTKLASMAEIAEKDKNAKFSLCVKRFIWGAVCLNWARPVLRGPALVRVAGYSPSFLHENTAKIHSFTKRGRAKAQERRELATLMNN
jgi:hypothetical protein